MLAATPCVGNGRKRDGDRTAHGCWCTYLDRGQVRRAARGTADNRRWPAGVDAATGVGAQVLEEVDRHRRSAWLLVGRVTGIGDDGECRVRELGCGLASLFDGRVRFEVAGLHEDRDVGHRGARQW